MQVIKQLKNILRRVDSLADQLIVSGGNFLTVAICAHGLPLSEQGKFTYVFASYMALLLMNVAGIFQGAAVQAPTRHSSFQASLARLQILQAALLSLFVSVAWLGGGNTFGWQPTLTEVMLMFAFFVVQQLADFDRRTAYIFSSAKRAVYSSAALYPIRIVGLLIIKPETVNQVLMVLILSALVPAVPALLIGSRRNTVSAAFWASTIKEHLVYSRLFIAGAPLGWLWSYIPIFLLGTMHGKEQAALLASIRGISNIANILMEQIETKVVADWARIRHGDGPRQLEAAVARLFKIGIAFWLCGLLVTLAFGREIVTLVLGDLYSPHWHLLVIGWISYGIYFFVRVFGIKHRALGVSQVEFMGGVCGVIAALAAGYAMIPTLAAMGAAWVYVAIAVAMFLGQQWTIKKIKKKWN